MCVFVFVCVCVCVCVCERDREKREREREKRQESENMIISLHIQYTQLSSKGSEIPQRITYDIVARCIVTIHPMT